MGGLLAPVCLGPGAGTPSGAASGRRGRQYIRSACRDPCSAPWRRPGELLARTSGRLSAAAAIVRLADAPAGHAPASRLSQPDRPVRQRRRNLSTPVHILWISGGVGRYAEDEAVALALGRPGGRI